MTTSGSDSWLWRLGIFAVVVGLVVGVGVGIRYFGITPSEAQAFTSTIIAALTIAIVLATLRYVRVTEQLALATVHGNEQTAANAALAVRMAAPVLTMTDRPGFPHIPEGKVTLTVTLINSGSGVATEVEAHTDWPDAFTFEAAVGWHDPPRLVGSDPMDHPQPDLPDPQIREWRFTDLSGTRYRQPVGGRPEPVEP